MKIAVSATTKDLNQQVNPVFGRCPGFLLLEVEGKEIKGHKFLENAAMNAPGGAGIVAAQAIVQEKVGAVISGNLGPNASMALNQAGIKVYQAFGLSIQEAVNQFDEGKLQEIASSNVPRNYGIGAGRGIGMGQGKGMGRGMGRGRSQLM